VIAGFYLKMNMEQWLFEENVEHNQVMLQQAAGQIDTSILNRMKDLINMLSMNEDIKNVDPNVRNYLNVSQESDEEDIVENERRIIEYFKSIKETHNMITFISYGTENGSYIEYPDFNPTEKYDPRKREWYINALMREEAYTSEPYLTQVTKDTVFSIDKRVEKDDSIVGVLSLTISLGTLMEKINEIDYDNSSYINILSPNNIFINSPENIDWHLKSVEELEITEFKNINDYNGSYFEGEIDGKRKVFNVYISPENGWKYISVVNRSEVLRQSEELMSILIITYFITLIILLIFVVLIANNIIKPIGLISTHMHKMANYKFSAKKDQALEKYQFTGDEIGEITEALFIMQNSFVDLEKNIEKMDQEIKTIDVNNESTYQLELSEENLFEDVKHSINELLLKVYDYIKQIEGYNQEISEKNELLQSSEEELIAQVKEIDTQKEYISFLADHDVLTKLPNRRLFKEELRNATEKNQFVSILLIDLDNFKSINDSLGHVFGDKVLNHIGRQFEKISTKSVFISRFGGDEFLILFKNDLAEEKLEDFIQRVFDLFKEDFIIDNIAVNVNFSIGISQSPKDSKNIDQLIMNADMALYEVKDNGKNSFAYFTDAIDEKLKSTLEIKNILDEAIANEGFKMVYQPQVEMSSGKVYAFEALVRLKNHAARPDQFIPIAEDNGLIIKIGRIITEEVIKDMRSWLNEGCNLKPISINFSVVQMHDQGFKDFLMKTLEKYNIDPNLIIIEITENIFIDNRISTIKFLEDLKYEGIKIAVDDFGTGFSSLSYLTFLPLDILKFDRSLCVKFLALENIAIMDSLIDLAHSLKLKVVAEGIEEYEQVFRLAKGKVDMIQGYYYEKPLEYDDVKLKMEHIYEDKLNDMYST
jgi:diguanylate cyclase (GGDEF)-like protein